MKIDDILAESSRLRSEISRLKIENAREVAELKAEIARPRAGEVSEMHTASPAMSDFTASCWAEYGSCAWHESEVERWVIKCISAKLIDAKMDQPNRKVCDFIMQRLCRSVIMHCAVLSCFGPLFVLHSVKELYRHYRCTTE